MYSLGFDEQNNIIVANFTGSLTKNEPMEYIASLITIKGLPERIKILQNFTKAVYDMNVNSLEEIAGDIKKYLGKFKHIKVATVHNKSTESAMSVILAKLIESDNLNYRTFSTEDAATSWLKEG